MKEQRRDLCGVPAPFQRVRIDKIDLAYSDSGSGTPVVCLHAIGHGGADFVPLRDRLGSRFRFVLLDWPGQGRSGSDVQPTDAGRYAQLLGGLLTHLGLRDVVLLGNSIGGAAAMRLAATRPEIVRGLVLANSGGLMPVDAVARVACRLSARFFAAGARGARWFAPAFRLYYSQVLSGKAARGQRERIVGAAYEIAPLLQQAWTSFAQPDADQRALAPRITCPVLCAWARQDQILKLSRSQAAIKTFPNARVQLFNGGHSAFLEDPDAFAAAFASFVDAIAPAAAAA
ncbi:MAG: alpha/beta hydrolase [Deltaproteobacteria bacterium]|nr:alpha/beta hydrolase [Deltaproteobacteria bacterium]